MKAPLFFGLNASPPKWLKVILTILPFALAIALYVSASNARLEANPADKLLPSISKMIKAIDKAAFTENRRTGEYQLWQDTASSLKRLFIGVGLAAALGLLLGLNMGVFKGMSATFATFVTVLSMIPPLAVLPILFIAFGVGEVGKITLIFLGTFPIIARDIYLATDKIPREQIVKAQTLGASQLAVVYRIVLPQILPRLLEAIRLSLGAAWLFLIASEAIASTDGLGYRIFLVRRYLSMDLIIPYVIWITFLGFFFDYILKQIIHRKYAWYVASK
ncbi:ABC transporter permease [Arenicella sp. 4NH20-0111]|uniref:ABC transporter permease n=1 Tax=Arenicella sp. 4NH20-0111 TaxID=3127648 RepID=UPI003106EC7C